ncbi:hypothetical protein V438_05845 [Clostridioides difficile]|nr:hypothetical protein V440_15485 [Clostridioides difficile]PCD13754.1 hypothetical protein V439_06910 [Clostridioides difficile]PCN58019.1 hypothetical protein V438_05845 [Clostridioides difficile]
MNNDYKNLYDQVAFIKLVVQDFCVVGDIFVGFI